jgi:hypothetical protein
VTTATIRGITTTKTTYDGEITTTRIVPVGKPPAAAQFMASDKAGNEYFATTGALANAAAAAFNRANLGRAIGNGVVYHARTKILAQEAASNADHTGYVNGVPVTPTPQFLATSSNGTAFWSNCSQARANTLARLDTNRPPRKVWHATNTSTDQVVTSAVSAKFANALAAYHYVGYTPGEVAMYGLNCQVLTANSATGLTTALRAQLAALPYVAYGGNFLGYDTTGANPADMQMFIGATQAKANALASAFGKRIVRGGVFVVDTNGVCATVGPSIKEDMAIQNIENPPTLPAGSAVPVFTGFQSVIGGPINVGGLVMGLDSFVQATPTPTPAVWDGNPDGVNTPNLGVGMFNAAGNMAYYDQGHYSGNPAALTTPNEPTHATLPTQSITCAPIFSNWSTVPPVTLLSYDCPPAYKETTP